MDDYTKGGITQFLQLYLVIPLFAQGFQTLTTLVFDKFDNIIVSN